MGHIQIQQLLQNLKNWSLNGERLEKEFVFRDYPRAILFINKLVNPAEEHQIYPQLRLIYNRLLVSIAATPGTGLTEREFALAKDIDAIK